MIMCDDYPNASSPSSNDGCEYYYGYGYGGNDDDGDCDGDCDGNCDGDCDGGCGDGEQEKPPSSSSSPFVRRFIDAVQRKIARTAPFFFLSFSEGEEAADDDGRPPRRDHRTASAAATDADADADADAGTDAVDARASSAASLALSSSSSEEDRQRELEDRIRRSLGINGGGRNGRRRRRNRCSSGRIEGGTCAVRAGAGKSSVEPLSPSPPPRESDIMRLRHVRQTETWDCGLACVQMVLWWLRYGRPNHGTAASHRRSGNGGDDLEEAKREEEEKEEERMEKLWMQRFVGTESVWTIDLVILLDHFLRGRSGARSDGDGGASSPCRAFAYLFCSTKMGVDESYFGLKYYRDAFASDERRVGDRFEVARSRNLPLMQVSRMSMDVLVGIVGVGNCVAIVLLDNRVLWRRNENTGKATRQRGSDDDEERGPSGVWTTPSGGGSKGDVGRRGESSYAGHYVVLCDISYAETHVNEARSFDADDVQDEYPYCMVVKNPGISNASDYVAPARFEKAWRAVGTDEDVIFIAMNKT